MGYKVGLSLKGNVNSDNVKIHPGGALGIDINGGRGNFRTQFSVDLGPYPTAKGKVGGAFLVNKYQASKTYNPAHIIGEAGVFAKAGINLLPTKPGETAESQQKHYELYGTNTPINRYDARGGIYAEMSVETPYNTSNTCFNGNYGEFKAGIESGYKYNGAANAKSIDPELTAEGQFYISPYVAAYGYLGKHNEIIVGGKVAFTSGKGPIVDNAEVSIGYRF